MKLTKKKHLPRPHWMLAAAVSTGVGAIGFAQSANDDEIFELSPFEVTTSENDVGYYSENTLMGTRLNSNIGDLASSITLVTRQQLEDTAATDINDIFLYEANTEGAHNYTAYHVNRGYLKDEASGISRDNGDINSAATSNRVRGLGTADTSQNNYPTISRIPFDTYNTQSVEINRGPNSMLFGMGSPAGIVNQTTANAALGVNRSEISLRYGSYGSWRASFNHNQSIIDDTLAVYFAGLREEENFRRKPSYENSDRYYAAITYKPLERTVLRGSYEKVAIESRRPNTIAPRDTLTPWIQSGRPVFDNNRNMVVFLDNGREVGPFTTRPESEAPAFDPANLTNPDGGYFTGNNAFTNINSKTFINTLGLMAGNPTIFVQPDGTYTGREMSTWRRGPDHTEDAFVPPGANDEGYAEWLASDAYQDYWRLRDTMFVQTRLPNAEPFVPQLPDGSAAMSPYYPPGLIDKSLYDWENINLNAPNFQSLDAETFNLELTQQITDNLFFSAGWFRQEAKSLENNPLSQTTPITLEMDVNMYLPTGEENPNYLKPFVGDYQADVFTNPESNNNLRAQLAYQFDFTDSDNWTRWLGSHQAMGLWSKNERNRYRTRSRIAFFDDYGTTYYVPAPEERGRNYSFGESLSRIRRYYYVGEEGMVNAGNPGIASPGALENYGSGGPTSFNMDTFFWNQPQTGGNWQQIPVELGTALWWPTTTRQYVEVESQNVALQSRFWENRIVTTLGWREDEYFAESFGGGKDDAAGYINGIPTNPSYYFNNSLGEESIKGQTSTKGVVFKVTPWMSLTYNESDNFNPPNGNATDFFGDPLPKPTGEGKDYGVRFSLLDNKLNASVNWFETSSTNARGVPGVFVDRTLRIDHSLMYAWADKVVRIRHGEDPTEQGFADNTQNPRTDAMEAEIWDMIGLPMNFQDELSVQGTQDTVAEGMEIQVIYNPIENWTMKFTAGRQETFFDNVAPQWEPWAAQREAYWQAATAEDMAQSYTMFNGRELQLRNFWNAVNYSSDVTDDNQNGWTNTQNFYQLVVLNEIDTIRNQEGLIVPGQREWRANFLTNYRFVDGALKGFSIGGSARWEEAGAIGNYGLVGPDGVMRQPDVNRPIYGDSEFHIDLWLAYQRALTNDIDMKIQLNVRDALESGGVQAVAANFDGSIYGYRYVDPRTFYLTTTFSF